MHFTFVFRLRGMILSELLIIFVNKVLITQAMSFHSLILLSRIFPPMCSFPVHSGEIFMKLKVQPNSKVQSLFFFFAWRQSKCFQAKRHYKWRHRLKLLNFNSTTTKDDMNLCTAFKAKQNFFSTLVSFLKWLNWKYTESSSEQNKLIF